MQREHSHGDARTLCRRLRKRQPVSLLLDGAGAAERGWRTPHLVAVDPCARLICRDQTDVADALTALHEILAARRRRGGTSATGIALLLAYDALDPTAISTGTDERLPVLVALQVDRSVRVLDDHGRRQVHCAHGFASTEEAQSRETERMLRGLEVDEAGDVQPVVAGARAVSVPRTSLPRETYLRNVEAVRRHIARGDIYQANLCQRFTAGIEGDAFGFYERLASRMIAPHSAFFECEGFSLASVSPESFVSIEPDGRVETLPIKGTRPRGATPEADRRAAEALLQSGKDRAELLMIVDLERNDLGRVCRTGSVHVPELAALRSFAAVHHLVARVCGTLRPQVGTAELLRAIFPGGSITGAPKRRAIQILRELEPARRNFFTGSLFWFGDDGSVDSSILIRTAVLTGRQVLIGAGGGIVTDSDPESEWLESNHKARALTRALGFDPEEAV